MTVPAAAASGLAAPPALAQAQARRDADAEAFVQAQASRILSVLGDRSMAAAAKRALFHSLVDQLADVPRITDFVLGKYNRSIAPAQKQQFAAVFRQYAQNVYETRLGDFHGETLKVTNSTVRQPGDVVVFSRVGGGQLKQPVDVNWRVLKSADGRWRAVDVQVQGVWLAITQQQDFVSTLDNAHGDLGVLIDQLRRQVAQAAAADRS